MEIKNFNIDDLTPYENNPRFNEQAVDVVAASIREFGFKVPVVIDKNNIIVAGHTRVKAAQKLGLTEVPVIVADDLTDEQVKAFRLADNKVGEIANWDLEKLDQEVKGIMMDLEQFGFIMKDLNDELEAERKETERAETDDKGSGKAEEVEEQLAVIITCESEIDQARIYNSLRNEGYVCKVVSV